MQQHITVKKIIFHLKTDIFVNNLFGTFCICINRIVY